MMKEKNIRELAKRMGLITVENMCQYTIAQLVVMVANKVNELVDEVWRFETDVQEILKTQNENIRYLLDEGLHLEVASVFDGWLQDGTFDTLINQSALKKVNERIDETNTQLSENKNELQQQISVVDNKTYEGFFIKLKEVTGVQDHKPFTVDDYYRMYDGLMTDTRFSYRLLGNDQSDTYPIRLYVYEPTTYKSTLFITCALHGWEHYGSYIMYLLFKMLMDDEKLPSQLQSLRNTRILCIPVANPWGLMADNHSGTNATRRGNSRGVDLNRNFNYRWEHNTGNFGLGKGDSAFSEIETKYIRDVMESYNITHFLDLHSFNKSSSETRDYLFYGNQEAKYNTEQMVKWLKQVYQGVEIEHTVSENDSSANNYANRVRSIPSMNTELIFNQNNDLNAEARKWLEFLINYLNLQAMSHGRTNSGTKNGCKLTHRENSNTTYAITKEWTSVPTLEMSYNVDVDGVVMLDGWLCVEVTGSDGSTIITLSPTIEQSEFYSNKTLNSRSKPYLKVGNGVHYIPFSSRFFARKGYGTANFKLEIILEGNGSATIKRKDATYLFIPCDNSYLLLGQHNKVVTW